MDLSKSFFVSGHQTQKRSIVIPTIFLYLFVHFQEYTIPTTLMGAMQWVRALLLFLLFGLPVFIRFMPLNKLIIREIIIVIVPYF